MKINTITKIDKAYYDRIGKECIESWIKYWPEDMQLTVYVEDFILDPHPRIRPITFDKMCKEYWDFQKSDQNKRVKTFSKKAYSIIHAYENLDTDRIIWIDADAITNKKIEKSFLENLCDDSTLISYMGVFHNRIKEDPSSELLHDVESSFFVTNKRHQGFHALSSRFREYYDKKITHNIRRFYDGDVLGAAIVDVRDKYKVNDWCTVLPKRPKSPMPHLPIGKYITHFKSKTAKLEFVEQKK